VVGRLEQVSEGVKCMQGHEPRLAHESAPRRTLRRLGASRASLCTAALPRAERATRWPVRFRRRLTGQAVRRRAARNGRR
jgi:hypothetical protein